MSDTIHCDATDCGREIDTDQEPVYFTADGKGYCETCHDHDLQYASTVIVVDGGERRTYHVGDLFVEDEWCETDGIPYRFTRTYHRTDAWRGYHETTIDGWTELTSGWTTGGWGDPIADRKQRFNQWANDVCSGEAECPVPLAIVSDPTSNVFSTAIGVFVPTSDVDTVKEWLGESLDDLVTALG